MKWIIKQEKKKNTYTYHPTGFSAIHEPRNMSVGKLSRVQELNFEALKIVKRLVGSRVMGMGDMVVWAFVSFDISFCVSFLYALSRETTLERNALQAGWSKFLWSGPVQLTQLKIAWTTADKNWRERKI